LASKQGPPEEVRILLADDHLMFRKGLKSLLEAEPGLVVVGEAKDGQEAVRLARALQPDVLLLDLAMPGVSGMEALASLSSEKALQLGAAGVVLKTSPPDLLFKSIRSVLRGEHWIGREAVSDLVQALRQYSSAAEKPSRDRFRLTPRELEITAVVVAGLTNKEIARKFSLSEDTVKHHLTNIYDKVGASNRLELALFAVHHRLLDDDDPVA
jgi:two-component system, NarL family, nitrate/nitrite response regulator NarL